jgi:hypothetical protein
MDTLLLSLAEAETLRVMDWQAVELAELLREGEEPPLADTLGVTEREALWEEL